MSRIRIGNGMISGVTEMDLKKLNVENVYFENKHQINQLRKLPPQNKNGDRSTLMLYENKLDRIYDEYYREGHIPQFLVKLWKLWENNDVP